MAPFFFPPLALSAFSLAPVAGTWCAMLASPRGGEYLEVMVPSQPFIPKDPPSYESLYHSIPSQSSYIQVEQQHRTSLSARLSFTIQRFIHRHLRFLQCLIAASTVSVTVMLLLWQLQNLSTPPNPEGPWLDHDEYSMS